MQIVGPGSWLKRVLLRLRIWSMGLRKQVSLSGLVPHENVGVLLQQADIFVNSDLADSGYDNQWPAALGEAMLYALPVVVSDLPAHTEIVRHEEHGLVVPAGDADALRTALLEFMHFPDKAKTLGKAGQERVQEVFESDGAAHALADVLLEAPKAHKRAHA